jgi:hypothetical protein
MELTPLKSGINRLRTKGGADPASLYDLVNGYVDIAGNPTSRPGTRSLVILPAGTQGLCAFDGKLHVFAMTPIDPGDSRFVVDVLIHPDPEFAGTLVAIHFAKPFLGFLYVVAEFSDGQVFHYWLQSNDAWKANTVYLNGDTVRPTSVNGFIYSPTTTDDPPAWAANTKYTIGDFVQPSTYNGYKYQLIEMDGDSPASGSTEPTWVASEGALIDEDVDKTPAPSSTTTTSTSPGGDRYDNLSGYERK